MDNPKISVIIPNYNKSMYLEQCIDSIFMQTYQPLEVIVVDDCSTDNSKEVLTELSKKYNNIRNIFLKKNSGVSYARNTGIREAKGDYLIWIDSDDFLCDSSYFENLSKYCSKNKLVYGKWLFASEDGIISNKENIKFCKKQFSKKFTIINLLYFVKNNYIPRNFLINKEALNDVGLFDESMSLYEDTDLLCRIADKLKFKYINVIGPAYRQTSNGLSKAKKEEHKIVLLNLKARYETNSLARYRKLLFFRRRLVNGFFGRIKKILKGH